MDPASAGSFRACWSARNVRYLVSLIGVVPAEAGIHLHLCL